jgi:hypothetical protein
MKTLKTTLFCLIVSFLASSFVHATDPKEIRLQISNGTTTDVTLIGFYANATDGWDPYDSHKMNVDVAGYPEMFSYAGVEDVAINGLPLLAVGDSKELTLGYVYSKSGSLTIKVKELLNLDAGTVVILKDKDLQKEQDLTINPEYTFTTSATLSNATRFSLIIKRNQVAVPVVVIDTVATTPIIVPPVVTPPVVVDTVVTVPVVTPPIVTPPVETILKPDFSVIVSRGGNLEVKLINLSSKNTKITVNSITGRRILTESVNSTINYISARLSRGQYIVTVSNKNFTKSRNIIVN